MYGREIEIAKIALLNPVSYFIYGMLIGCLVTKKNIRNVSRFLKKIEGVKIG